MSEEREKTYIDFETIRRLCILFDCDIGTLLSFDNASKTRTMDTEENGDEQAEW